MRTHSLYLPPETLMGHSVAYHPYNYVIAAGGQVDGTASITWLVPQFPQECDRLPTAPTPAVNANINRQPQIIAPHYMPTQPELLLPLASVNHIEFSPDGRYLAVTGSDSDRDKLFIYSLHFPSVYSAVENSNLRIFCQPTLQQQLLNEFSWAPDSSSIAVASPAGQVVIVPVRTHMAMYDCDSNKVRQSNNIITVKVSLQPVMGISWLRDGYLIAVQTYTELLILVKKIQKNRITFQKAAQRFSKIPMLFDGQSMQFVEAPPVTPYLAKGREKYVMHNKSMRTFYSIALYRRQVAFSPDGSFLVSTAGSLPMTNSDNQLKSQLFCSYVFTRKQLCEHHTRPNIILPGLRAPSVAVAFSPILYELDPSAPNTTDLCYRMLFAITSGCDCCLYDTQTFLPVCYFEGENYQLDYLTSVSFNHVGTQLLAFGARSQYQFFDLDQTRFKPLEVNIVDKNFQDIVYQQMIAQQKVSYCKKYVNYLDGKAKTKPVKPAKAQREDIILDKKVRAFSVSELHQFDLQTAPQLEISRKEVDYICRELLGWKGAEKQEPTPQPLNSINDDPIDIKQ